MNFQYTFLIAFGVLSTAVAAEAPYQPGVGFPIVGVAAGQSARVNALNLGSSSSTPDSSCTVTLRFLDTQGQQLKQTVVTIAPGKAAFLDLSRDDLTGDAVRSAI